MRMNTLIALAITLSSTGFAPPRSSADRTDSGNTQTAGVMPSDASLAAFDRSLPPEPWAKDDPADSLYSLARSALSRGDYKRAAEVFHRLVERYPQSKYVNQARYYEAFSLYR